MHKISRYSRHAYHAEIHEICRELIRDVRGEACAGPGRERERCICIMAPSAANSAISSRERRDARAQSKEEQRQAGNRCGLEMEICSSRCLEAPDRRRLAGTGREIADKPDQRCPTEQNHHAAKLVDVHRR
jgi:hypothetical protein